MQFMISQSLKSHLQLHFYIEFGGHRKDGRLNFGPSRPGARHSPAGAGDNRAPSREAELAAASEKAEELSGFPGLANSRRILNIGIPIF